MSERIRYKVVHLGYMDSNQRLGWVEVDGVWRLRPEIFSHKESVEERGGRPEAVRVTVEFMAEDWPKGGE